eukprot:1195316-Prorocentrum_minimum.AAC.1
MVSSGQESPSQRPSEASTNRAPVFWGSSTCPPRPVTRPESAFGRVKRRGRAQHPGNPSPFKNRRKRVLRDFIGRSRLPFLTPCPTPILRI